MKTNPATLEHRAQIEAIWAERLVYADSLNAERRAKWEARKAVLFERDLPISVPKCPESKADPVTTSGRAPARAANVSPLRTASHR